MCTLRIVRYGHDGLGRLTSITYPSGREVGYVYDSSSTHPVRITVAEPGGTAVTLVDNLTFDAAGQLVSYTAGSVSLAASFDLSGQFISRTYTAATGHGFDWTIDTDSSGTVELDERDGDGNPLQVGDVARSKLLSLTYDDQARLTSSLGTNLRGYQDCEWVYDPVGNRVGETCYGTQVSYEIEPTGNELLSTTYATNATACNDPNETVTQTRTRDVIGRQTNGFKGRFGDATADYSLDYGADTRLARATVGTATYDYVYDHRMLRWRTTAGGTANGTRDTVYGESGSILHEKKYSGEVHEYVWLGSRALGLLVDSDGSGSTPATLMALGTDHLATPHRAWDTSAGTTTWAGDYTAFGECESWIPGGSTVVAVSLRFPGQIEDEETEIHYNHWYRPGVGKYNTPDPLGFEGGDYSLFAYAANSAQLFVDSSGQRFRGQVPWLTIHSLVSIPGLTNRVTAMMESSSLKVNFLRYPNGSVRGRRSGGGATVPAGDECDEEFYLYYNLGIYRETIQRYDERLLPSTSMEALIAHELGHVWGLWSDNPEQNCLALEFENYARRPGPYREIRRPHCRHSRQ